VNARKRVCFVCVHPPNSYQEKPQNPPAVVDGIRVDLSNFVVQLWHDDRVVFASNQEGKYKSLEGDKCHYDCDACVLEGARVVLGALGHVVHKLRGHWGRGGGARRV
jgi:hypothetical protein